MAFAFSPPLPLIVTLVLAAAAAPASAATIIGVVAPLSGNYETLGKQVLDGATFQATAAGDIIVPIDETCEAGSGAAIAEQLISAKATVALGFLCGETMDGALPALTAANIPAITLSIRSSILMDDARKAGWTLFRMAPSDRSEADKLIEAIGGDWQSQPFALIEDGTIHGRELEGSISSALEAKGMKPVFTDTFRPGQEQQIALVRRLAKAGASRVFVGGDRSDVSIIARDAAAQKIPLTILGGDAMNAANEPVALADGVRAVTLPDAADNPKNAPLVKAMLEKGIQPQGYVLPAHAAAALASAAVRDALAENQPIAGELLRKAYDTSMGPIRFNENHELSENPYRLLEWQGNRFTAPKTE